MTLLVGIQAKIKSGEKLAVVAIDCLARADDGTKEGRFFGEDGKLRNDAVIAAMRDGTLKPYYDKKFLTTKSGNAGFTFTGRLPYYGTALLQTATTKDVTQSSLESITGISSMHAFIVFIDTPTAQIYCGHTNLPLTALHDGGAFVTGGASGMSGLSQVVSTNSRINSAEDVYRLKVLLDYTFADMSDRDRAAYGFDLYRGFQMYVAYQGRIRRLRGKRITEKVGHDGI